MKSVVVGVDGSAESLKAVRWAAAEAVARRRPLTIVHCSPLADPTVDQPGTGILTQAAADARAVAPDLDVGTTATAALAIDGLLTAAEDAELLVLGAHGIGSFEQLLLGSTSREVVARASSPVVVVRGDFTQRKRIVVGIDGSAASIRAAEFAFAEASWRDALLVTVHACGFPEDAHDVSEPLREQLHAIDVEDRLAVQETLAGWREDFPDVRVEESFVHGQPL